MSEPEPAVARTACLTEQEVARVRAAPPGELPRELALHLARCDRCQERVLFGPGRKRSPRQMPNMPSPGRALFLLVLMLAAIMAFLVTLRSLVRGL